jgi:hypothetical protein
MIVSKELKQLTCQTLYFEKIIFNLLKFNIKINILCFRRIGFPCQDLTNYAYLSVDDKNCHSRFCIIAPKCPFQACFICGLFIVSVRD